MIAHTNLRRLPVDYRPNPARVILRAFLPSSEPANIHAADANRIERLALRVLAMPLDQVEAELDEVMGQFASRHVAISRIFADRFLQACRLMGHPHAVPDEARRLLIGAYFSHEYSFEAAALFNPSIVADPDQRDVAAGELRFILSLRATGEGHVSSLCFGSGIVGPDGEVRLDPPGVYATTPVLTDTGTPDGSYAIAFSSDTPLAERIIFPITPQQRNGLEDARFVRFTEEDGRVTYYATYTAYSGREIVPELMHTDDFRQFRFLPITGDAVRNKGLALFPRRIGGQYVMLTRVDGQTLQLSRSDDLQSWNGTQEILGPSEPWEFVQIGNCGSPIELPEGWLVITHGVGSMRRYSIGAALLDLEDPSRVLGRLREPLLTADAEEREGYVPNTVYSCGALVHEGQLILPYSASDNATKFAVVPVAGLLAAMG